MALFDMDKNSLPVQVQQNKEDIKDIKDNIIPDSLQEAKDYTDNHVVDADHITSDNAASGKILTADGDGGVAWDDPSTPTIKASNVDSESESAGKVLTTDGAGGAAWDDPAVPTIKATNIDSETATAGQVLTADGNGGAAWQAPPSGGANLIWSGSITLSGNVASIGTITFTADKLYKLCLIGYGGSAAATVDFIFTFPSGTYIPMAVLFKGASSGERFRLCQVQISNQSKINESTRLHINDGTLVIESDTYFDKLVAVYEL